MRFPFLLHTLLGLLSTSSICFTPAAATKTKAVSLTLENSIKYHFDTDGNAIDSTSGKVDFLGGSYVWYGIAFGCGEAFCGITSYSSPDMKTWSFNGFLFDPTTPEIVTLCATSGGCGRPHILYREETKTYILWVNADAPGYALLTSSSPTSGYKLESKQALVGRQTPGTMAGDFTVALINGTGYIVYSLIDFSTVGASIWPPFLQSFYIQPLAKDLMNTTGTVSHVVSSAADLVDYEAESPDIFYRAPYYYIAGSNTCGFCTGTLLNIFRSRSPSGPWTRQIISPDTCGGQLNGVQTLPSPSNPNGPATYLNFADLQRTAPLAGTRMAAHGHQFQVLEFNADGSLKDLDCSDAKSVTVSIAAGEANATGPATTASEGSGQDVPYVGECLLPEYQLYQTFTASKTGSLVEIGVNVAGNSPTANVSVTIFRYQNDTNFYTPRYVWETLATAQIPPSSISAAFETVRVPVGKQVAKGDKLGIALLTVGVTAMGVQSSGANVTPVCVLVTGGQGTGDNAKGSLPQGTGGGIDSTTGTGRGNGSGRTLFAIGANQVSFRGRNGKTPPIVVIPGQIKWYAVVD